MAASPGERPWEPRSSLRLLNISGEEGKVAPAVSQTCRRSGRMSGRPLCRQCRHTASSRFSGAMPTEIRSSCRQTDRPQSLLVTYRLPDHVLDGGQGCQAMLKQVTLGFTEQVGICVPVSDCLDEFKVRCKAYEFHGNAQGRVDSERYQCIGRRVCFANREQCVDECTSIGGGIDRLAKVAPPRCANQRSRRIEDHNGVLAVCVLVGKPNTDIPADKEQTCGPRLIIEAGSFRSEALASCPL